MEIPAQSVVSVQPSEKQPWCLKNIKNYFLPFSLKRFADIISFLCSNFTDFQKKKIRFSEQNFGEQSYPVNYPSRWLFHPRAPWDGSGPSPVSKGSSGPASSGSRPRCASKSFPLSPSSGQLLGIPRTSCCAHGVIRSDPCPPSLGAFPRPSPPLPAAFPCLVKSDAFSMWMGWVGAWRKLLVLNTESVHRHKNHQKYSQLYPHIDRSSTCPGWFFLKQLFCKRWQILAWRSSAR